MTTYPPPLAPLNAYPEVQTRVGEDRAQRWEDEHDAPRRGAAIMPAHLTAMERPTRAVLKVTARERGIGLARRNQEAWQLLEAAFASPPDACRSTTANGRWPRGQKVSVAMRQIVSR